MENTMDEYRQDWADFIAKSIESYLEYLEHGKSNKFVNIDFLGMFYDHEFNSHNIKDTQLFCVYTLADSYFDVINEPQETVDGLPINIAKDILLDCVEKLKRGEKIDNQQVLKYSDFQYSMIDHLKKRILSLFHRK